MSNINPNCDGSHCVRCSEVRVYPLGGGANLILCQSCFLYENQYRARRADPGRWPVVAWESAAVYPGVSAAQEAYEADVASKPLYHDGTKRKAWADLGEAERWSWGREVVP